MGDLWDDLLSGVLHIPEKGLPWLSLLLLVTGWDLPQENVALVLAQ